MTPTPAVIFDIGNVILRWDARLLFRHFFAEDAAIDAFLDETGFHDWNLALDAGLAWDEAVARQAERHPRHAAAIRAFHARWHETLPGAIDGSVAILDELATAGVALYAITNYSAEKWAETLPRFPFLATAFRDTVVSGREGVVKPDARIFRRLLERNGLAPEACVFVDDSPKNVAAGAALGMDAILFTTPAALRDALAARGLIGVRTESA